MGQSSGYSGEHLVGLFKKIIIGVCLLVNLCVFLAMGFSNSLDAKDAASFGGVCADTIAQRNDIGINALLITNVVYIFVLFIYKFRTTK
ncbi:hypothetical protein C9J19_20515 [Photobacterium phosphoreum]|nr:hypothetical protein C9J19_20515 [Photobacterium phosphoreum]